MAAPCTDGRRRVATPLSSGRREHVVPAADAVAGHLPGMPAPPPLGRRWGRGRHRVAGPVVAAVIAALLSADQSTSYEAALLTFLAFAGAAVILRHDARHATLLPLVGAMIATGPVLLGALLLDGVQITTGLPGLAPAELAVVGFAALFPSLVWWPGHQEPARRVAVIGSLPAAEMLARELEVAGVREYRLVGAIPASPVAGEVGAAELPVLGRLAELGEVVERHGIDLLLMTSEVPRLAVFEELAESCLHLPVRLWELSGFYEETFGHVPVAEINASWFQYIMHPRYRGGSGAAKRSLDLALAALVAVLVAPLLAVLALLVRRDGGPAIFRQERIGEGGRPFVLYKLRTMRAESAPEAVWSSAEDSRVTPVGRFLRRTHLDELPQLLNIMRGEMTLVGPRPEQPSFVERLEQTVPFYSRRHLIKPGVTGWAQVRCGYAGSDTGSAWKLCHDLYYLKHRSLALDVAILAETLRTLVADPQYSVEPAGISFILRPAVAAGTDQPDGI